MLLLKKLVFVLIFVLALSILILDSIIRIKKAKVIPSISKLLNQVRIPTKRRLLNKLKLTKSKSKLKDRRFYISLIHLFRLNAKWEREVWLLLFYISAVFTMMFIDDLFNVSSRYLVLICIIMGTKSLLNLFNHVSNKTYDNVFSSIFKILGALFIASVFGLILDKLNHFVLVYIFSIYIVFLSFSIIISFFKSFPGLFLIKVIYFIGVMAFTYSFIGLIFGYYYWENNDLFKYFNKELYDYTGKKGFIWLAYIGLKPMFSYPELTVIKNPLSLVPFGEFFLGVIINIMFIGIGVSFFNFSPPQRGLKSVPHSPSNRQQNG